MATRARAPFTLPARLAALTVPVLSAEAAALFRIVVGAALVAVFTWSRTGSAEVPDMVPADAGPLMQSIGGAFVASPALADWITPLIAVAGGLVIAGLLTRVSFAALTAGVFAWSVVYSLRYGHHPVSALLVAMICLLPARMADAWSVEAALRQRASPPSREYGYAIWVTGVVFGIALAAAAAAKLRIGGVDWILNGTVKYHFLSDAPAAPVDWGVRFALAPAVAVALSFGAIAIEMLMLPAALVRWYPVRALAGLAGVAMLTGFYLFQGLFWPGWWILLLSFAPWHLVGARARPAPAASFQITPLGCVQAAVIVAVAIQQVVVSTRAIEAPPLLSAYDMYSETYSSPAEYERRQDDEPVLMASMGDGTSADCRIGEDDVEAFKASSVDGLTDAAATVVASCFPRLPPGATVTVQTTRQQVDWTQGRLLGLRRVHVAGPFRIAER